MADQEAACFPGLALEPVRQKAGPVAQRFRAAAASRQSWATLPVMTVVTLSSILGGSCSSKSSACGLRVRPYPAHKGLACAVVVLSG